MPNLFGASVTVIIVVFHDLQGNQRILLICMSVCVKILNLVNTVFVYVHTYWQICYQ